MTELKNSLQGFNKQTWPSRRTIELEEKSFEMIKSEKQNIKVRKKSEQSRRDLWETICNIMGTAER
jgi:hypothetical protein